MDERKKGGPVMGRIRATKSFFSSQKETAWLDEMGQKGCRLVERKDGRYFFEEEPGKQFYYRVEWLGCSPESEEGASYVASRAEVGETLCTSYSLWGYFLSETPIGESEEGRKRTAVHYRNTAILLYVFDAVAAVLAGYHFVVRDFLERQGLLLQAPTLKKSGTFLVDLGRRLAYGAKELLYRYAKLWSKVLGDTKATTVLAVLIPLVVILSVLGGLWAAEWRKNRPAKKPVAAESEEEEKTDEQTEVSGEDPQHC